MNEKNLEELVKVMAEAHSISLDSAASMITVAMRMFSDLREAIIAIGNALSGAIDPLWESLKDHVEQSGEEQLARDRQAWPIVWDTRKQSQVLSNKPKFMIRKIIN